MLGKSSKRIWNAEVRDALIATLPKNIMVDIDYGIYAQRNVYTENGRWRVTYSLDGAPGGTEFAIYVVRKSLFKAVHKAHKRIASVCVMRPTLRQ